MAALVTAITDVFEPAIWSRAFLEETTAKNLLVQSGIAATNPEIEAAAAQGGRTVDMPFWDDLSHNVQGTTDVSKVATDTDDSITPHGLTSDKDVAVKNFRTQSFSFAPVIRYTSGGDPAGLIISRFATWWAREEQRLTLKTLTGIFADATVAAALSNDISGEVATTDPAKLISSAAVEDTRFLLGDAYDKLTAIIVHSTVFKRMRSLDLVETVPSSQQNAAPISTYMGLRVLVDDNITTAAGSTSGTKYSTFLFGQGAFARTDIPLESGDPNLEVYRQPLKGTGSGQVDIISRRYFLLHPRGIKYVGSLSGKVSPSDSDLAADNWTQVYLTKNIRIARLITNG